MTLFVIQIRSIPLHYPHQLRLQLKNFNHNKLYNEIMILLLLLHNIRLQLLHIILRNQDHQILKPQIQYNFKQQLQQHDQNNQS